MSWKRGVIGGGLLGLLWQGSVWAQGNQIQALTQPVSDVVVTVQIILGAVATILLMVSAFLIIRQEGAGLITLIFALVAIIVAVKAGDIIGAFGPSRAAATGLTPVVITAGQQVLDALQSLVLHGSAGLGLVEGIRRGRRA